MGVNALGINDIVANELCSVKKDLLLGSLRAVTESCLVNLNTVIVHGYGHGRGDLEGLVIDVIVLVELNADSVPAVKLKSELLVVVAEALNRVRGPVVTGALGDTVSLPHIEPECGVTSLRAENIARVDAGEGNVAVSKVVHRVVKKDRELYVKGLTIGMLLGGIEMLILAKNVTESFRLLYKISAAKSVSNDVGICLGLSKSTA